jgi:hypothetical protein
MATVWTGFVDDAGHFALDQRKAFIEWVKKFKGYEVVLEVRRRPRMQGSQQLRYYRGVVVPDIAKATGVTDPDDYESVHEGLAWKFLRLPDGPMGEPRRRSTSKGRMSMEDLSHYIDQVITWAETSIPDCRVRRPHEIDLEEVVTP